MNFYLLCKLTMDLEGNDKYPFYVTVPIYDRDPVKSSVRKADHDLNPISLLITNKFMKIECNKMFTLRNILEWCLSYGLVKLNFDMLQIHLLVLWVLLKNSFVKCTLKIQWFSWVTIILISYLFRPWGTSKPQFHWICTDMYLFRQMSKFK